MSFFEIDFIGDLERADISFEPILPKCFTKLCSIFWIPISIFVDWLDDKYDLGYLDEILGGDDTEDQKKPVSSTKLFSCPYIDCIFQTKHAKTPGYQASTAAKRLSVTCQFLDYSGF